VFAAVPGKAEETFPQEQQPHEQPANLDDVFAWLRWSPPAVSPSGQTLMRCFPRALPATAVMRRTSALLRCMDKSLTPETVLFAQSICPDEINHDRDGLMARLAACWGERGEAFPMGGLGGAPHVGKTGFTAFSHHVPDHGHILILFGPHIAISEEGQLGKFRRAGQMHHSPACGAVLAAYNASRAGDLDLDIDLGEVDMSDIQQYWLRKKVHGCMRDIEASPEPLRALVGKVYAAVEEQMLRIVHHEYGDGKLFLLGGIQINLPKPYEEHFLPLMFRVSSKSDPEGLDLLPEIYKSSGDIRKGINLGGAIGRYLATQNRTE